LLSFFIYDYKVIVVWPSAGLVSSLYFFFSFALNLFIQPSASSHPNIPLLCNLHSSRRAKGMGTILVLPCWLHIAMVMTYFLLVIKVFIISANPWRLSYSASAKPTMYSSNVIPSFSIGELGNTFVILSIQSLTLHSLILTPICWFVIGKVSLRIE